MRDYTLTLSFVFPAKRLLSHYPIICPQAEGCTAMLEATDNMDDGTPIKLRIELTEQVGKAGVMREEFPDERNMST